LSAKANLKLEYGAIKDVLAEKGIQNPSPKDVSNAVIHIRSTKLPNPAEIGNCGSFFKNPVVSLDVFEDLKTRFPAIPSFAAQDGNIKIPAAWLIDQAGWKGKTFGNIGVHKNQALVLVNYGGGNGLEIKNLAFDIIDSVKQMYGIKLSAEVNILGSK
jgi:UDP-N-acetylmuramate dehydrogenase